MKYPVPTSIRLAKAISRIIPWMAWRGVGWAYAQYAVFRYRHAQESLAALGEFLNRRTKTDITAAIHRLDVILESDPRDVAAKVGCPVHYLAGFWDPIVPCWLSRGWLKRHVPTYAGGETIFSSDHAVLASAPDASAQWTRRWMSLEPRSSPLLEPKPISR